MIRLLKEELKSLGSFLRSYSRETVIIVSASLFIILDHYRPLGNEAQWLNNLLYYAVFPVLVIIIVLRKNPLDFGLRPGAPRVWGLWAGIVCLAAAVILYAASFSTALQIYYRMDDFRLPVYFITSLITLAASEFFYRGFLLFGLKDKFREGSILLQMIPFALLHLGKPEIETVSTIITGILFGYITYRGKSFWPALIIHLFINVYFVALINFKYPV